MNRLSIQYHLFVCDYLPLVKLVDRSNEEHIGYLDYDVHDNKGFVLLPIDVNEKIKHFKASHIKEIRSFKNDYKWKDASKSPKELYDFRQKQKELEQ